MYIFLLNLQINPSSHLQIFKSSHFMIHVLILSDGSDKLTTILR